MCVFFFYIGLHERSGYFLWRFPSFSHEDLRRRIEAGWMKLVGKRQFKNSHDHLAAKMNT
jgi:hypothetical protein